MGLGSRRGTHSSSAIARGNGCSDEELDRGWRCLPSIENDPFPPAPREAEILQGYKMVEQTQGPPELAQDGAEVSSPKTALVSTKLLKWSPIVFSILQSACTAVMAISGLRVAIGLSALAAAAGIHAPARGFHQDAIRIPMMVLAFLGAVINLFVIWKVRNLRSKPAAKWRQQPVPKKKLNSERFQIALSVLTLLLLAAEWITHPMVHRIP